VIESGSDPHGLPQLIVLPHIGSASLATRSAMVDLAVDNILAAWRGTVCHIARTRRSTEELRVSFGARACGSPGLDTTFVAPRTIFAMVPASGTASADMVLKGRSAASERGQGYRLI